jgi:hypothetical protein
VVSWFRYGHPERLDVVLRDGSRVEQRLAPDGRLPSTLGVELADVHHLDVWLSNELLRSMTLIDTPGLGSLNRDYSDATESLLRSEHISSDVSSAADALVFLVNGEVKSDELGALQTFRRSSGGLSGSAANAVGVLSKIDKLASGPDWWDTGVGLAKRIAAELSEHLVAVVPIMGLMAETAETAALNERDVDLLRTLAEVSPGEFSVMLMSSSDFVESQSAVSEADRERLLTMLDLQGVGEAIDLIRDGTAGAIPLRRALSRRSGVHQLRDTLLAEFRGHGGVLKIRTALRTIERYTYRPPTERDREPLRQLRDQVERLRLEPAVHAVAELEALHALYSGELHLPEELAEDVRRLVSGGDPAERIGAESTEPSSLKEAAVAGSARWRRFEFGPTVSPRERHVAHVVKRSFALAWFAAEDSDSPGPDAPPNGAQE